jgi:hypothetical protein
MLVQIKKWSHRKINKIQKNCTRQLLHKNSIYALLTHFLHSFKAILSLLHNDYTIWKGVRQDDHRNRKPDSPGHHTNTISDEQDEKELDKVMKGMVMVLLT